MSRKKKNVIEFKKLKEFENLKVNLTIVFTYFFNLIFTWLPVDFNESRPHEEFNSCKWILGFVAIQKNENYVKSQSRENENKVKFENKNKLGQIVIRSNKFQ